MGYHICGKLDRSTYQLLTPAAQKTYKKQTDRCRNLESKLKKVHVTDENIGTVLSGYRTFEYSSLIFDHHT